MPQSHLLWCVRHGLGLDLGLHNDSSSLGGHEVLGLLVLLDQVAAAAAPRLQEVGDKVTLQVWRGLGADIVTLENVGNAVETAASNNPPAETRSVYDAVTGEAGVLVQPVVGLAKGDAGAAAGDSAGVNGLEALEEPAGPRRSTSGVGDGCGVLEGVGSFRYPSVKIILRSSLHWLLNGGHCCFRGYLEVLSKMERKKN